MWKLLFASVLAAASLTRGEETRRIDDFDQPELSDEWVSLGADLWHAEGLVPAGLNYLRCRADDAGAWIGRRTDASFEGLRKVTFQARSETDLALVVELKQHNCAPRFWRKVDVAAGDWQRVEIPLYQFRMDGVPRIAECDMIGFRLRSAGTLELDGIEIEAGAAPSHLEPMDAVARRAFGGPARDSAETTNFRVLTDSDAPAKEVAEGLEAFLGLFQERMGLPGDELAAQVTLVIHAERAAYVDFVARTAREVYGGVIDPKGITAGGFTFERYSCTSYDPEQGAKRPVFYHEACHQLVTQCLGLRGPNGASWAEEGICYYLQNEYLPQANLAEEVGKLLENPKRPSLDSLKDTTQTTGAVNMTGMLVMAFLAEGPHKDRLAAFVAELREGHHDLARAVDRALGMKMGAFASEWEAWVRATYR